MNIMTADGVKDFYQPETPVFSEQHIKQVHEFVEFMNKKTIAGWNRKFPCDPPMTYEWEVINQVVLTHVPQVEHPTVYSTDRK